MYDALQFVGAVRRQVPSGVTLPLIELLLSDDEHGREIRNLLGTEASERSLSPAQVGACALFQFVGIAVSVFGRNRAMWHLHGDQIAPICDRVRQLGSIEKLGHALMT